MSFEALRIFDPRRSFQLQGFSGRAVTTTIHDATETGFQISGILQAAEDFANVQLFLGLRLLYSPPRKSGGLLHTA